MKKIRFKDYLIDYLENYNITNKDFANRIGITPKHLGNILAGHLDISQEIANKISLVTSIPIDYIYKMELNYKFEENITKYLNKEKITETKFLNKFCYTYLIEKNYIEFVDSSNKLEIIKDILKFLRVSTPEKINEIDKAAYYKTKNEKPELLLLWLEKCYRETLKQEVAEYKRENIDKLVKFILISAKNNEFDEIKLVSEFNNNGIYLVIQEDIPSSKIRGALKVHRGIPAIYLTYKHRRLADIYFALLHELAHCKTDFNKAQSTSLVSYEDNIDEIENNADLQAYEWMINSKDYTEKYVKNKYDIENENIYPKSFIVYKLAKENYIKYNSKIYQKYNPIIH